jgi:hypothetical protein
LFGLHFFWGVVLELLPVLLFLLVVVLLLLKLQQNFQWGLLICYVIAFVFPRAFVCDL